MKGGIADQELRRRTAGNIQLLKVLTDKPHHPFAGPDHRPKAIRGGYQLPMEREKQLADGLAFIARTTSDEQRIPAVAVEEDPSAGRMTIRLACNNGKLDDIKAGFEGIARLLERAALRVDSREELKRDMLRHILHLDHARILSRIRSIHAPWDKKLGRKRNRLHILNDTIEGISESRSIHAAKLARLKSKCNSLKALADHLDGQTNGQSTDPDVQDTLVKIVTLSHTLAAAPDLEEVLANSNVKDPVLKTSLPTSVKKLGHYFQVACDLIDAARNKAFTIFSHVAVDTVFWGKPCVSDVRPNPPSYEEVLLNALKVPVNNRTKSRLLSNKYVHQYGELVGAESKFGAQFASKSKWSTHAEIQLLLFYEGHPSIKPPREICSSKDACYLCHLFIKIHGRFAVPRTHGVLYEKWFLPEFSGLPDGGATLRPVVERFNDVLERQIRQTLNRPRIAPKLPNESTLAFYLPWPSTSTLVKPGVLTPPDDRPPASTTSQDRGSGERSGDAPPGMPETETTKVCHISSVRVQEIEETGSLQSLTPSVVNEPLSEGVEPMQPPRTGDPGSSTRDEGMAIPQPPGAVDADNLRASSSSNSSNGGSGSSDDGEPETLFVPTSVADLYVCFEADAPPLAAASPRGKKERKWNVLIEPARAADDESGGRPDDEHASSSSSSSSSSMIEVDVDRLAPGKDLVVDHRVDSNTGTDTGTGIGIDTKPLVLSREGGRVCVLVRFQPIISRVSD